MTTESITQHRRFKIVIFAIAATYFIFELFFSQYTSFSRDEFWFAQHIFHYTYLTPYKDFLPYKAVLGYYLLSVPFYFVHAHAVIQPLVYIKDEIALLNSLLLCCTSFWALKFFRPRPLLITLVLLLSSQLFFIYSADLRVDMLASWCCLLSALALLDKRFVLSGGFLAMAFLICQKALWYILGTDAALLFCFYRDPQSKTMLEGLRLNLALFAVVATYFIFWSSVAGVSVVWHSLFYEAYTQSKITYYAQFTEHYWQAILRNGPVIFMLWPLAVFFIAAGVGNEGNRARSLFIASYASSVLFLMMLYQQTFPYNMVFVFPAFYLLFGDFFSRMEQVFLRQDFSLSVSHRKLFWFLSLYVIGLMATEIIFSLHAIYGLVAIIPLALYFFLILPLHEKKRNVSLFGGLIFIIIFITGIAIPLIRQGVIGSFLNGDYQRATIRVSHSLLGEGEGYLAGTPMLYDKVQPVTGLKNLIQPAIDYLHAPTPALLPILIASLDMQPRSKQAVLQDLQQAKVKVILENERLTGLPSPIIGYLRYQYEHYYGSAFIYAPIVFQNRTRFTLKFSGRYQIETQGIYLSGQSGMKRSLQIDGESIKGGEIRYFTEGQHRSAASQSYRLKLVPDANLAAIDPRFFTEKPEAFIKPTIF